MFSLVSDEENINLFNSLINKFIYCQDNDNDNGNDKLNLNNRNNVDDKNNQEFRTIEQKIRNKELEGLFVPIQPNEDDNDGIDEISFDLNVLTINGGNLDDCNDEYNDEYQLEHEKDFYIIQNINNDNKNNDNNNKNNNNKNNNNDDDNDNNYNYNKNNDNNKIISNQLKLSIPKAPNSKK